MTTFEVIVGAFIITNTLLQFWDIVICRFRHCGKSSKNSTEPKQKVVTPSEDFKNNIYRHPVDYIK